MRFVKDHFDEYRESTIGGMLSTCNQLNDISYTYQAYNPLLAAFLAQTISLDDNTTVKFEIWYVADEFFYSICVSSSKHAYSTVMVFFK
jgi:Ras-related protein Rab-5C